MQSVSQWKASKVNTAPVSSTPTTGLQTVGQWKKSQQQPLQGIDFSQAAIKPPKFSLGTFIKDTAKEAAKLPLRMGASVADIGLSGAALLGSEKAKTALENTKKQGGYEAPFGIGKVRAIGDTGETVDIKGTQFPATSLKDIAGAGAEAASYLPIARLPALGAQALKQTVIQGAKAFAKEGAIAGGVGGAGHELQNPESTFGSVAEAGAIGSLGGAVLGGALGGSVPILGRGVTKLTGKKPLSVAEWKDAGKPTAPIEAPLAPESARTAPIAPKVSPLAAEARKYKSAEEFVKAQGTPTYRGTADGSLKESMDTDYGPGFYFADKKGTAGSYGKSVGEYYVTLKNPLVVEDRYEMNGVFDEAISKGNKGNIQDYLIAKGYDGILVKDGGLAGDEGVGSFRIAFNKDQIKTKSQLTDIWNKATKGGGREISIPSPLAQEAQKYSSAVDVPFDTKIPKTVDNLYHATTPDRLNSIVKNGITSGNKSSIAGEGVSGEKNISLAGSEKQAAYYVEKNRILLRTKAEFDPTLEHDTLGGAGNFITKENIPPNMLEIKTKDGWQSLTDFYNKAVGTSKTTLPKQTDSLAAEARKYKSAEEFVKSIEAGGTSGFGGNKYSAERKTMPTEIGSWPISDILRMESGDFPAKYGGFEKLKLSNQDMGISRIALSPENYAKETFTIYRVVPKGQKINAGDFVFDTRKAAEDYLSKYNRGDSIVEIKNVKPNELLITDNPSIYSESVGKKGQGEFIYAPESIAGKLKTKSQLTDIWNKATKGVEPLTKTSQRPAADLISGGKSSERTGTASIESLAVKESSLRNAAEDLSNISAKPLPDLIESLKISPDSATNLVPADVASIRELYTNIDKKASAFLEIMQKGIDAGARVPSKTDGPYRSIIDIKRLSSILDKIGRKRIKKPYSASDMGDLIRGDLMVDSPSQALKVLDSMKEYVEPGSVGNHFEAPNEWGYRGMNFNIKLPDGTITEVQVHTPLSSAIKDAIHSVYNKYRSYNKIPESAFIESRKLAEQAEAKFLQGGTPKANPQFQSRVFERLKAENPSLEGDLNYNPIKLKEDAEKAVNLITKDKQKAFDIAMGKESSSDVTSTAVNIAMAEKALNEGNIPLYTRLIKNRSLEQTRRGQEIVAEKGSVTDNSTSRYVKELIALRLEKLGNKYLADVKDIGKKTSAKQKGTNRIEKEVQKMQTQIKEKKLTMADARELLDALACV